MLKLKRPEITKRIDVPRITRMISIRATLALDVTRNDFCQSVFNERTNLDQQKYIIIIVKSLALL